MGRVVGRILWGGLETKHTIVATYISGMVFMFTFTMLIENGFNMIRVYCISKYAVSIL